MNMNQALADLRKLADYDEYKNDGEIHHAIEAIQGTFQALDSELSGGHELPDAWKPRPPLNGAQLLAALPIFLGDEIREYTIVARTRDGEYVCALAKTLQDAEWYWGHYYSEPGEAIANAYVRAGIADIDSATMRKLAKGEAL